MGKILILVLLTACSTLQKTAVNTTADIAEKGQYQIQTLNSWEQVQKALPAQLAFAETLLPTNPENSTLLTQLIKGYSAYGFVVGETQILLNENNPELKNYYIDQAKLAFARALNFGMDFFASKNIKWNELYVGAGDENKLTQLLDEHLNSQDQPAVFFLGQAWASLINLSRDNIKIVNHLPIARALVHYTCKKNPEFENGMCNLFEAIYQLSRPNTLGGNHELGHKLFADVMKKYPLNLLYPVMYAQFVLLPQGKIKQWNDLKSHLKAELDLFWKSQTTPKYLQAQNKFHQNPENNLYNMLASVRLENLIFLEKKYK